ncbi:hypothetical protein EDD52_104124 [Primorskyibacter sedentarius]|uniref:Uncharacterized protein n=1 Tax=Primorskyibacter sedentarius TaxID=745311 RepID=A0A4R3JGQ8_9RHOB|nr:hypothetical protein [Primorskyibacter sedentarius]TCS65338.1 hypothetical protein EDD52_104124 [Primorskyibacter sedentarius]
MTRLALLFSFILSVPVSALASRGPIEPEYPDTTGPTLPAPPLDGCLTLLDVACQ